MFVLPELSLIRLSLVMQQLILFHMTLFLPLNMLLFFYILIECLNLIHSIMYPLPTFVVIKFSSPAASSFLRSRVTLTVRVFSST